MAVETIGIVSDTHGLVRDELLSALAGSDYLVHAGDVGNQAVLDALGRLAPVIAVRGNNDCGRWAEALPEIVRRDLGGLSIVVLHDLADLTLDPLAEGIDLVVAGHSHRPSIRRTGGVTYLNPGSAGPRRFRLPVACGRVQLSTGWFDAEIVHLDC